MIQSQALESLLVLRNDHHAQYGQARRLQRFDWPRGLSAPSIALMPSAKSRTATSSIAYLITTAASALLLLTGGFTAEHGQHSIGDQKAANHVEQGEAWETAPRPSEPHCHLRRL